MNNKKCIPLYGRLSQSGGSGSGGGGGIIPTGTKEINITENGTYSEDVAAVATADIEVNVPQPSGATTINVNANGESDHDVTDYATAHVVVDVPKPTAKKTVNITANGTTTEDVADFGSVDIVVNVAGQAADDWKDIFEKFISGNGRTVKELTLDSSSVRSYAFYGTRLPDTVTLRYASKIERYGFAEASGVKTLNIPNADTLAQNSFHFAPSLVTINAEALQAIEMKALNYCYRLTTINAPNLNRLSTAAINGCPMEELYFPKLLNLGSQALSLLTNLKKVTFGDVCVRSSSISDCNALETLDVKTSSSIFIPTTLSKALIIRDITAVPTMENTVAELKDTLNVYVPDDLVDAFKAATNWSAFGDRIKPLSTYVES